MLGLENCGRQSVGFPRIPGSWQVKDLFQKAEMLGPIDYSELEQLISDLLQNLLSVLARLMFFAARVKFMLVDLKRYCEKMIAMDSVAPRHSMVDEQTRQVQT